MHASVWVTDAKANGKGRSLAFARVVVAIDLDVDIAAPFGELVVEKPHEGVLAQARAGPHGALLGPR